MKGARRAILLAAAAVLGMAGPALAYYSFSMFDNEHQTKIEGTVTNFEWTNPHVYIQLTVADAGGAPHKYTVDCANPGSRNRVVWKFNVVKPGDKLKLVVAPLRENPTGGGLLHEMV